MTLFEIIRLLRKKLYLLIVLPLLLAGGTAIYCWGFMTNDYTSTTTLYILEKSESESVTGDDMTASQQLANDIAVLATSNRILGATATELNMEYLDGYEVSVSSESTNRIISLSVTGKNAESVVLVTNELADQIVDTAIDIMDLRAVNIVDRASASVEPSGPNRILYTAIAFLVALFLAVTIILLSNLLSTRIKSSEEAEDVLGLPILGRMPAFGKVK